jgi:hypothetical protein
VDAALLCLWFIVRLSCAAGIAVPVWSFILVTGRRYSWGCKGSDMCCKHIVLFAAVLYTAGVTCMHSCYLTAAHQFGATV